MYARTGIPNAAKDLLRGFEVDADDKAGAEKDEEEDASAAAPAKAEVDTRPKVRYDLFITVNCC